MDDEDYDKFSGYTWGISKYGYALRSRPKKEGNRSNIFLHREIMGAKKGEVVDHINHNTVDNRKENLRFCNNSENAMNRKSKSKNSSGVYGITWNKKDKRWKVSITKNGTNYYLGSYTEFDKAIKIRKAAEIELFGEFANINYEIDEESYKRNIELEQYHKNEKIELRKRTTRGVYFAQTGWVAQIHMNKEKHYLGFYKNKEDAIKARKDAEIEFNLPEKFRC